MSKFDRKKKRDKKRADGALDLPKLAKAPRREKNGRASRVKEPRGADKVALDARAKHMGLEPGAQSRATVRSPSYCGQAGRAIMATTSGEEAARLTECFRSFLAADTRYCRRILGCSRNAKTAKLEMIPEKIEARADDPVDLRDPEEADEIATRTWMVWQGYLGHLSTAQASSIKRALAEEVELVKYDGALTRQGSAFVGALMALEAVANKY